MVASAELELTHGDTKTYEVTITNDTDGLPVNLSTGDLRLGAKLEEDDATPLFELTVANGGITYLAQSGATLGKARVEVDAADLASIPNAYRTILFDVEFTVGGKPLTAIRGLFRVKPRIGT